jgi:uncharacterized protein YcgI (DUF1989 family)
MGDTTVVETIHVPAREGRACTVRAGQLLKVIDVEGQQVVDLIAFNADAPREEKLSGAHTANFNLDVRASVGSYFWSSQPRPMFEILEDDAKGVHDYFYAACSAPQYEAQTGDGDHPNCRDNLTRAVEPFGLGVLDLPNPINLFQNTFIRADGKVDADAPVTGPGDSIVLRALVDVIVAVSTCPWDSPDTDFGRAINGPGPSPARLEILDPA